MRHLHSGEVAGKGLACRDMLSELKQFDFSALVVLQIHISGHQGSQCLLTQASEVRKGGLSSLQAPASAKAAEVPQSATMKGGSPRRLTAKTSNSMFSCSAAKQYERLDNLASARKSVIEADMVAHLQQATLGYAASLPVGLSWLLSCQLNHSWYAIAAGAELVANHVLCEVVS